MLYQESQKNELLKQISIYEIRRYSNLLEKNFGFFLRALQNFDATLYDLYCLEESTLLTTRNIGEKRFEEMSDILKNIKSLNYKDILQLYKEIHKFDDLSTEELVYKAKEIINSDENILIDNCIEVNNTILWKIFLQKTQNKTHAEISKNLFIDKKSILKIINKIKCYQYKQGLNDCLELLSKKIENGNYVVNYIYTYKEIEIIYGQDVLILLKYNDFLNGRLKKSSFYKNNLDLMLSRIKKENLQNLAFEINKNQFLSSKDKTRFIKKLNNWKQQTREEQKNNNEKDFNKNVQQRYVNLKDIDQYFSNTIKETVSKKEIHTIPSIIKTIKSIINYDKNVYIDKYAVKYNLLWQMFIGNMDVFEDIHHKLDLQDKNLQKIKTKLKNFQYEQIRDLVDVIYDKLLEYKYKIDYICTYNDIEEIFGHETKLILQFYKWLKGEFFNIYSTIFCVNIDLQEQRVKREELSTLINEINNSNLHYYEKLAARKVIKEKYKKLNNI